MNEQLQQSLAQVIEQATSGVQAGVSFLSAELPDVIHQLLMWKMVQSLIMCVTGFIVIIAAVFIVKKLNNAAAKAVLDYKNGEKWTRFGQSETVTSWEYDAAVGLFHRVITVIISMMISFSLINLTWLKIWIAPKVYLIEYAASLVK